MSSISVSRTFVSVSLCVQVICVRDEGRWYSQQRERVGRLAAKGEWGREWGEEKTQQEDAWERRNNRRWGHLLGGRVGADVEVVADVVVAVVVQHDGLEFQRQLCVEFLESRWVLVVSNGGDVEHHQVRLLLNAQLSAISKSIMANFGCQLGRTVLLRAAT